MKLFVEKGDGPVSFVPNLEFSRTNTKSLKFSQCFKVFYEKSGVGLLKTNSIVGLIRMGGPS